MCSNTTIEPLKITAREIPSPRQPYFRQWKQKSVLTLCLAFFFTADRIASRDSSSSPSNCGSESSSNWASNRSESPSKQPLSLSALIGRASLKWEKSKRKWLKQIILKRLIVKCSKHPPLFFLSVVLQKQRCVSLFLCVSVTSPSSLLLLVWLGLPLYLAHSHHCPLRYGILVFLASFWCFQSR